jgi:hypothetical protein
MTSNKKDWVKGILGRYRLRDEYERQRALLLWPALVGENISRLTRPQRLHNGTLWIEVASHTLSHELNYMKDTYMAKLNEALDEQTIRDIRFVPGSFVNRKPLKLKDVTEKDRQSARALFADLSDLGLRRGFERLYLTQRQREETLLAAGATRCEGCGTVFFGSGRLCPGCHYGGIEGGEGTR